jgi:putative tricarboxylic transport membrane protein
VAASAALQDRFMAARGKGMTSERGPVVSVRRDWRNPGGWLGLLTCLCSLHAAFAHGQVATVEEPLEHLTLIAPSDPGGGWDLTAQAMKQVLESEGIVRSVEIENIPGGGGLVGLSKFVSSRRADSQALLVGGMSMVGAAVSAHALSALNEMLPIAQLTSDADVVVVPASSPYRTLDDLLAAMRRNPEAMRWTGGSVGGSDHPTIWQLARAAGVAPELMRYEPFQGTNEVATQLASGRFSAGISGYSEFDRFIRSGKLRGLAMVSRQPIEGVSIPTFRQLGIVGVSIANWCGAFAPPASSEINRSRLAEAIQRMVQSPRWRATLTRFHLRSAYLGATDFYQLVRQEQTRISKAESTVSAESNLRLLSKLWEHRLEWTLALAGGIVALLIALCWQKLTARHREESLRRALQELSQEVERRTREAVQRIQDMAAVRVGMNAQIEREFDRWGLTGAERSVAHLTLKGLRLKDIARARNTSDRTVRQQAQAIYRKAGLDGRTDLSAYFLESVLGAPDLDPQADFSAASAVSELLQATPGGDPVRTADVMSKTNRQHAYRRAKARRPPGIALTAISDSR